MDVLSQPTLVVAFFEVLIGLALLTKAADRFVDGAVGVAGTLRMSPVVIGAVIVGFGTSAPELLVSGLAALDGDLDLGVGNVVGSNVANLTLVLGSAAFLLPLRVSPSVLAKEAPLALGAVLLFALSTRDGLQRWEGIVLLAALVLALSWIILGSRSGNAGHLGVEVALGPDDRMSTMVLHTAGGLVGTVLGAQLLVWGATEVAVRFGLSGGFIGFTLVAIGTSLPELVTAAAAARKGQTELLLGNLLGSNMFNSLAVGGAIAVIGPGKILDDALSTVGVLGMVLVAALAWFFMVTRKRIYRLEAAVLLAIWVGSVIVMAG